MEVFLMECVKPTIISILFFLILIGGCFLSGCIFDNPEHETQAVIADTNSTAIAIALNDSRLKTYLAYDGSYEILYAGPTDFESGTTIFNVTGIEVDTPSNLYHVYVNVTNGTVDHIWSQPKRSSPAVPVPGSTQDPVSTCSPQDAAPIIPVPVDTSVPIQDPMPAIRYSFNRSESGRTIVLEKGDVVEINLGYATGQPFQWIVQGSGCGIELLNAGAYSSGGDFWNDTGNYRARYRAVSPGTSVLNGKLVLTPEENGMLTFNLTMIVK